MKRTKPFSIHSIIAALLLLLLVIGGVAALFLAQQQQDVRQQAAEPHNTVPKAPQGAQPLPPQNFKYVQESVYVNKSLRQRMVDFWTNRRTQEQQQLNNLK